MDKEQIEKLMDKLDQLAKAFVMLADAQRMSSSPAYFVNPKYPQTNMGGTTFVPTGTYNLQQNDDGTFRQVKD